MISIVAPALPQSFGPAVIRMRGDEAAEGLTSLMTSLVVVVPAEDMTRAGAAMHRASWPSHAAPRITTRSPLRGQCRSLRDQPTAPVRQRQPTGELDAGMLDGTNDHHAGSTRIVVLVPDASELRQHVQPVAGKFGPSALRHPHAVEPCRLDHGLLMGRAGCAERTLVKE